MFQARRSAPPDATQDLAPSSPPSRRPPVPSGPRDNGASDRPGIGYPAANMSIQPEQEEAFLRLLPELEKVREPIVPFADPHSAAVAALLVTDYLAQPDMAPKVAALAKGGTLAEDGPHRLQTIARALLHLMAGLGGDWFWGVHPLKVPELRDQAIEIRDRMIDLAERGLHDPDARLWIEAIKKGAGDVDLLIDLRSVVYLYTTYQSELERALEYSADDAKEATACAERIEAALSADEAPDKKAIRGYVARAFTLLVPLYEEVCRAGRFVSDKHRAAAMFPELATLSRARRQHIRKGTSGAPSPFSQRRPSGPVVAAAPVAEADPFAAGPASGEMPAAIQSRRNERVPVEMAVGLASESNFYQGFTENLSEGGVFVATYNLRPIGTKMEVRLGFHTGEDLVIPGIVRWVRSYSDVSDAWPGLGIQFDGLTKDQEEAIQRFIKLREPLFYDD